MDPLLSLLWKDTDYHGRIFILPCFMIIDTMWPDILHFCHCTIPDLIVYILSILEAKKKHISLS